MSMLLLILAVFCFCVPVTEASSVKVSLSAAGTGITTDSDSIEAEISAEALDEISASGTNENKRCIVPGTAEFELKSGLVYSIAVKAAGFWAETSSIYVKEGKNNAAYISLYPTGVIHGLATTNGEDPLPKEIKVRFQPTMAAGRISGDQQPQGTVTCPIADDGAFRCLIPAGMFDLKLRAVGHVSHYLWRFDLGREKPVDLGKLQLQRGSSLVGWVTVGEGGTINSSCKVRVEVSEARGPYADNSKNEIKAVEVKVNSRGFFHIQGIEPGNYALEARQDGFAPARMFPLVIREGMEAILREPLVLQKPATVKLKLEPATDPWGQRWQVELNQMNESGQQSEARSGLASEGGEITLDTLPGYHDLSINDDAKSIRWLSERLELKAGINAFDVEIPLVRVAGSISLGGEPVIARIWFGGSFGGQRVPLISDEEGLFAGTLPRHGEWLLEVDLKTGERMRLEPVVIDEPESAYDLAEIDLIIPSSGIEGAVVNKDGESFAGAKVEAKGLETDRLYGGSSSVSTSEDGRFVIRGQGAGTYTVKASAGSATSDSMVVQVPYGDMAPFITLVLREKVDYRGVVRSADGEVAGATIMTTPVIYSDQPVSVTTVESRTRQDGSFTASLPSGTSAIKAMVFAHGHALGIQQVSVAPDQPINLMVPKVGGTLKVILNSLPQQVPHIAVNITYGDFVFTGARLMQWAYYQGTQQQPANGFVTPMMPAGTYKVCMPGMFLDGNDVCKEGTLSPYSELELVLDIDMQDS